MNAGLNQYAVYRLRLDLKETRVRRHQTYSYLTDHGMEVRSGFYRQLYLADFDPSLTPDALRRQLEKELPAGIRGQSLDVGDVLAVTKAGITTPYYVDREKLLPLSGFFHVASSKTPPSMETTDYQIEGRSGNWSAVEELWLDGRYFLLMQSQEFGRSAAYAVVDSYGRPAAQDTTKGFTEEVTRQLREHIRSSERAQNRENARTDEEIGSEGAPHSQERIISQEPLRSLERNASQEPPRNQERRLPSPANSSSGHQKEHPVISGSEQNTSVNGAETVPALQSDTTQKQNDTDSGGLRENIHSTENPQKKNRFKRRRKGRIPLKRRRSILKRLREYQMRLSLLRNSEVNMQNQ